MIGQTLGHYEITGSLGKGGMGEVWRARDTNLGREVAIKTLPTALAADADRLARFEREARLLATLNHAHIAAVYGLDEHNGLRFLAMELIEGQTLEERLKEGPLPLEEALRFGLQIAQALEAAHEKGVVHRDLKPANVMIARDVVKVLDFGLAKAFSGRPEEASPAHSPALSLAMTQQGIILGTAAYMSPEQASGQTTDQRADVWSFGVVLYELLTGMPLFSGESVPHVLADVLRTEPDWKRLPKNLHPRLRLLLERCLVKKPKNRYHSMADVRIDLEEVLRDPRGIERRDEMHGAGESRQPLAGRLTAGAAFLVAGAVIAALVAWTRWPAPDARPVTRFSYDVESVNSIFFPSIASDGSRIGFVTGAPTTIHVLDLDEFEARPIPDTEAIALSAPCFSPDASWIAFPTNRGEIRKAPVAGGRGIALVQSLTAVSLTCHWGDDGHIYFSTSSDGLMRVPENGGTVETLVPIDAETGEIAHVNPYLLPGGRALLYSAITSIDTAATHLKILDLDTRQATVLLSNAGVATYAPSGSDPEQGHIVFGQDGAVFAVPFDVRSRQLGASAPVLEGVMSIGGFTIPAVSSSGTLAYMSGDEQRGVGVNVALVGRDESESPLGLPPDFYENMMISPDGDRAAIMVFSVDDLSGDIWIYEFEGGRFTLLTAEGGFSAFPIWSADGERLIYAQGENLASTNWSIVTEPADNSALPVTLGSFTARTAFPLSASPDGRFLVGVTVTSAGIGDVWTLPLDEGLSATPATNESLTYILDSEANEQHATFSPDGRWIAYSSNETGRDEVYVIPFPGPGGKNQVSIGGGRQPRWNPAGGDILYLSGTLLMTVPYETTENAFRPGTPAALFDTRVVEVPGHDSSFLYDVTPDGERFLMLRPAGPTGRSAQLRVVQNWFEELREQVPLSEIAR